MIISIDPEHPFSVLTNIENLGGLAMLNMASEVLLEKILSGQDQVKH